eukprot:1355043-Amphidinium_carterae.3
MGRARLCRTLCSNSVVEVVLLVLLPVVQLALLLVLEVVDMLPFLTLVVSTLLSSCQAPSLVSPLQQAFVLVPIALLRRHHLRNSCTQLLPGPLCNTCAGVKSL